VGRRSRSFGNRKENGFNLPVKHLTTQEENRTQGLILGRGRDISVLGKVDQKGANLCNAHLGRMAFIME